MSSDPPPPPLGRQPQPDGPPPEGAETYPPPPTSTPSTPQAYPPPPVTAGQLAEWWRRLVAIVLDGLIPLTPLSMLLTLFGIAPIKTDPVTDELRFNQDANLAANALSLAMWAVYSGVLEGNQRGATVGKMALGIAVRDGASGGPIGFGRAALRRLVYGALWVLFFIPGLINVLSPLWDARRQAWHDKAVNTVVVRTA